MHVPTDPLDFLLLNLLSIHTILLLLHLLILYANLTERITYIKANTIPDGKLFHLFSEWRYLIASNNGSI
jgi:hypothetical protein